RRRGRSTGPFFFRAAAATLSSSAGPPPLTLPNRCSMPASRTLLLAALLLVPAAGRADDTKRPDVLPDTKALTMKGYIAEQLVAGVDKFLLRETALAAKRREAFYRRDTTSPEDYAASLAPNRSRLARILGVRDAKVPYKSPEYVGTKDVPSLVGKGTNYEI